MTTINTIENTIHPEIPRAPWTTNRYFDDDDRVLIDEHAFDEGIFRVELQVSHRFEGGDVDTGDAHAFIRWVSSWSEGASNTESFAIRAADLDNLLSALGKAREALAP
ncbi:hypothetical protein [Microbacterium sp. zg-YB36]|uniref:hypothetical protein n=1 Tax=Microbacterium sp. zg-YB36 TaxID=2969407 RepID=UPI00214B0089|nr:hypothetical protein [Microbacterium sp. zg-YB36]MDL5350555.1 hypothetical protein [Microbacterium sp. zg-YB36]